MQNFRQKHQNYIFFVDIRNHTLLSVDAQRGECPKFSVKTRPHLPFCRESEPFVLHVRSPFTP